MPTGNRGRKPLIATGLALLLTLSPLAAIRPSFAQSPEAPPYYAITGVRIVTGTGNTIDDGTIVVRDGLIEAVGANTDIPAGVWTLDGSGLTAYPGLIDAMTTIALPEGLRNARGGAGRGFGGPPGGFPGGGSLTQETDPDYSTGPLDRPATFTWIRAADEIETADGRIESWRSAGFTSALSAPERGLLPGQAALINLAGSKPSEMVVRANITQRVNFQAGREFRGYPGSLMGGIAYVKQLFFDAAHYDRYWTIYDRDPNGVERPPYDRSLEPLRKTLNACELVMLPADWAREILRVLRIAREIGVNPVLYGGHQAYEVAPQLAATDVPILVNVDWPVRDPDGDPEEQTSLQTLRLRDRAPTAPATLHEAGVRFAFYSGDISRPSEIMRNVRLAIRAGLPAAAALHALTLGAAEIFGVDDRLGSIEPGKIANLILAEGDIFTPDGKIRQVIVDGHRFEIEESDVGDATRGTVAGRPSGATGARGPGRGFDGPGGPGGPGGRGSGDDAEETTPYEPVPMVSDRGPVRSSATTLIRGGTVMTVANGIIENSSVLVRDGKIAAVGQNINAPADAAVIDASGKFVIPGIIDAHSHIATEAVNEGSVSVSAMVGIEDVIHPDQISIYRALAGGVTTVNVLHGSANPIGGKNAVLKLRWGADAEGMRFEGAPPGIKFALGENTKRERSPGRYPNSRMGVIDVIRQTFIRAQEYREEGRRYERALSDGDDNAIPPRRDLVLDAMVEIMEGRRLVHAHSYRADEILQLLRTAEEFGFRIQTLQHVLEGYKIADEIVKHGAGASTFSDWWAYKVEAYDAIPHNAALMTERGVTVSINSDSGEEMRHLNQEAAKTVRWGNASEEDALKMVTLNPATQLGIADRVGSIEEGKDADLVIYDQHPLSVYAVVQLTMIDGDVYFDREHDRQLRDQIAEEMRVLTEKHGPRPEDGRESAAPTDKTLATQE